MSEVQTYLSILRDKPAADPAEAAADLATTEKVRCRDVMCLPAGMGIAGVDSPKGATTEMAIAFPHVLAWSLGGEGGEGSYSSWGAGKDACEGELIAGAWTRGPLSSLLLVLSLSFPFRPFFWPCVQL